MDGNVGMYFSDFLDHSLAGACLAVLLGLIAVPKKDTGHPEPGCGLDARLV